MSYIITDDQITVFKDRPYHAPRSRFDDETWDKLMHHLRTHQLDAAVDMFNESERVTQFLDPVAQGSKLEVRGGEIFFDGRVLDNYTTRKALHFMHRGLPYQPILRFIELVQENPSFRAVQDLYKFLEAGQMPLTEDGHFLAYKYVYRQDDGSFVDNYTKKLSNNPGDVVEMPRNQVNEDPDQTCSYGLHACSYTYLPQYDRGTSFAVVVVKIHPADVVAIPNEYHNAKMRVCRYTVLHELPEFRDGDSLRQMDLYTEADDGAEYEEEIEEDIVDPFDDASQAVVDHIRKITTIPDDLADTIREQTRWSIWTDQASTRPAHGTRVDVVHRDGCYFENEVVGENWASDDSWTHDGRSYSIDRSDEIIAYRVYPDTH